MTMPHLMNCRHSADGWCLECVKELHADFETAEAETQRMRKEFTEMLPLAYAVEEWASGRITAEALSEQIAACHDDNVYGLTLMSRLVHLESEEKKLLDKIAYLKAALDRKP